MAMVNGNLCSSTMRTFVVQQVYGAELRGRFDINDNISLTNSHPEVYTITLDEISEKFQDDGPKIRDLTDYFLAGDCYEVKWDPNKKRVTDICVDVKGLRLRRAGTLTVSKFDVPPPFPALGYVIMEGQSGVCLWTKAAGGSLVFAPMGALCDKELRSGINQRRDQMMFSPVAAMVKPVSN